MKKLISEFKTFALQGNMLDLAVGLIIGTAFGTVVSSLVNDVVMPLISWIFGQPDFSNLFLVLQNKTGQEFTSIVLARESGLVVLAYGQFLNSLVAFLLSAMALFLIIKGINTMKAKFLLSQFEKKKLVEIEKTPEIKVLEQIRDLLSAKNK